LIKSAKIVPFNQSLQLRGKYILKNEGKRYASAHREKEDEMVGDDSR
jgi:hypothetical protein